MKENKEEFFTGEVRNVIPKSLIKDVGDIDDVDKLFLTLALIYNDTKNIHFFWTLFLAKVADRGSKVEISFHNGEYSGIRMYIIRILLSTIAETFTCLEKNRKILESKKFKEIKDKLSPQILEIWNDLVDTAINEIKSKEKSSIFNFLRSIRGDITYHYENVEHLPVGFREFFYKSEKNIFNKRAYYSLGNTMEKSRLFYADVSAEYYIDLLAKRRGFDTERIKKDILGLAEKFNLVLINLLRIYLRQKKNG